MAFVKGQSGNAGGRAKGSVNKKTLIRKELDAAIKKGDMKKVLCALLEKAKAGKMDAIKLLLEYRWGRPIVSLESDVTVHNADTARQELETTFGIQYVPPIAITGETPDEPAEPASQVA